MNRNAGFPCAGTVASHVPEYARGMIGAHEPPALRKLGLDMSHWTMQVKGIGSGYWRAVGTAEELLEKAAEIPRTWLCGVGFARFFNG